MCIYIYIEREREIHIHIGIILSNIIGHDDYFLLDGYERYLET